MALASTLLYVMVYHSLDRAVVNLIGEAQQTERNSCANHEPDCTDWCVGGRVDVVPKLGKGQRAVPGKSECLSTGRKDEGGCHGDF